MGQDTDFGGAQAFPTTRWTLLAGRDAGSEASRAAFEELARRYWRPIAAYVRARWERTDDGAREATQDFFLWMLERGFLDRADPGRGSFRGFVKRSLAHFLQDRARRSAALKRGGGARPASLTGVGDGGEPADEPADPGQPGPEAALDAAWRSELLAQAADALEAELAARGRPAVFAVFRDYYLEDEELDYAALAERHGISTVDVSNHLMHAKRRYRALLRSTVLETVGSDEELRAELAWLFAERAR